MIVWRPPSLSKVVATLLLTISINNHWITKSTSFVVADFGDFVDPTYNCPARTTCKQVCVASIEDCPDTMRCLGYQGANGTALQLCPDGTCADTCEDDEYYQALKDLDEWPCAFQCAPVPCAKAHDVLFNTCLADYGMLYDAEKNCGEQEHTESIKLFTYTEPFFLFCYIWIVVVTCLLIAWSAFNQRFSPVPGSTQPLTLDNVTASVSKSNVQTKRAWQTGYKSHPIGSSIGFLTIATHYFFHALIIWLALQYYLQQAAIGIFEDEAQSLLCFIVVWMVAFFWTFAMKWPYSIATLTLRRCLLQEATQVAICIQSIADSTPKGSKQKDRMYFDDSYLGKVGRFYAAFFQVFHDTMSFIFSDTKMFGPERLADHARCGFYYEFCKVKTDSIENGVPYLTLLFRRYNLSVDEVKVGKFIPGIWKFGGETTSCCSLLNLKSDLGSTDDPKSYNGLSENEVTTRRGIVGLNKIEMKKPTFMDSMKREVARPFYTYQIFMILSWTPLWYFVMAMAWLIVVTCGALISGFFQYRNEKSLFQISKLTGDVKVIRDGKVKTVADEALVPGDTVLVSQGLVYCDMVLVAMTSTILVDESALTGETTAVGKTVMDLTDRSIMAEEFYDSASANHKRHTILAGTSIVETDDDDRAIAIVTRTASFTARGEMIREIYSYKRHKFKFDVEIPIVLTILFFYAVSGWILAFKFRGEILAYGWFAGIYVVASVVPPLLPTVFTMSVSISDSRLNRKRITCTQAESILVAGKVTRAFFDKTGTLTKYGLDFLSALSSEDLKHVSIDNEMKSKISSDEDLTTGMAVCHTLKFSSELGPLVGNPVDRVMFENAHATLKQGDVDRMSGEKHLFVTDSKGSQVEIVKHFDFDYHRTTQSVIIKDSSDAFKVYVKGSGESIKKRCTQKSLPENFDAILRGNAMAGIYQISIACKSLNVPEDIRDQHEFLKNISRDEIESDLTFVGVINFKNLIRDESADVIRQLTEGQIQTYMITGDSVLTGACIAKEAGIITPGSKIVIGTIDDSGTVSWRTELDQITDAPSVEALKEGNTQIALSMDVWNAIRDADPTEAALLKHYVRVFGRCTPIDKVSIVSVFVEAGYVTMMCGDGGNDCGALKTAHIGIALSDAEASIVAPFTSLDKSIGSVVEVLQEGRCALASALASYKYIMMYGQVETMNQLLNAYFATNFAALSWMFLDGIWTISLAFSLPLAKAATKLPRTRPTASLFGLQTLSSVMGVLALNFVFTVISLSYLNQQDWYSCRQWQKTDLQNINAWADNYEAAVLFLVTGYQYVAAGIVYNFGFEFRGGWFHNRWIVFFVLVFTIIHFYVALVPGKVSCTFRINCTNDGVMANGLTVLPVQNPFNTTVMPASFRRGIVYIVIANTAATVVWEYCIVNGIRRYYAAKRRGPSAHGATAPNTESA